MSRIPIYLYDKLIYIDQNLNLNKSDIPVNLLNILVSLENITDNIIINKETSREDAKALSDTVLSKISDKQKELYDVEIFVDKEDDATFPIIGYRHKGKDKAVSWTVDR